jgi:hypothetical protein
MKKLLSLVMTLSLLICLSSCGKYTNSYKAIGLVRSQGANSCKANFYSLEGRLVFKIKSPSSASEYEISYSANTEKGGLRIYYDIYGTKEELAHVKAGESVDAKGGYVEGGKTVYIIIEAAEGARGKFTASIGDKQ